MSRRPVAGPSRSSNRTAQEAARLAAEQAARRRHDRNVLLALVVGLVVLVVGGGIGVQAYRTKREPVAIPAVAFSEAPQPVTDGQPVRFGADSAPVKVTLYEDFHCPHCADFETELGPTLTAAQTAGTVQTEVYPMSFRNAGSVSAANAFGCASEAGFGQRYYLGLFANHTREWSDSQLLDLAGKVGGSRTDAFASCVTSDAKAGWVASISAAAEAKAVNQTPTLLLDGSPVEVVGLTPAALQTMIDTASSAK